MWKYGTLALAALLCAAPASAQVVRLEITSREPMHHGAAGRCGGPVRTDSRTDPRRSRSEGSAQRHHPGSRPGAAERARQSRVRRDLRTGQARRSREGLARAPLSGGQSRERTGDGERRGRHHARERLARRRHPDRDQPEPRRSGRPEEGRLARDRPRHRPSLRSSRTALTAPRFASPRSARHSRTCPPISHSPTRR